MPAAKNLPSQAYLRECFDYDPETGEFRWRIRPIEHFKDGTHSAEHTCAKWNARYAGQFAGNANTRHTMGIGRVNYKVHRLIWKLVYNEEPLEIDHIDGNALNNRLSNLRPATRGQNQRNLLSPGNASGLKGVYKQRDKWIAYIVSDGVRHHLGVFNTAEGAYACYCVAAELFHGEFANFGTRGGV